MRPSVVSNRVPASEPPPWAVYKATSVGVRSEKSAASAAAGLVAEDVAEVVAGDDVAASVVDTATVVVCAEDRVGAGSVEVEHAVVASSAAASRQIGSTVQRDVMGWTIADCSDR